MEDNKIIEFKYLGEDSPIIIVNEIEAVRNDKCHLIVCMKSGRSFKMDFRTTERAIKQKKNVAAAMIGKTTEEFEAMKNEVQ